MKTAVLSDSDYATLQFLALRGYDGGALKHAVAIEDLDDGSVCIAWDNNAAGLVAMAYMDDPHAFLACCGSETLTEALLGLVNWAV